MNCQQQREQAATLLLTTLQKSDSPVSLQELELKLNLEAALPSRAIKEAAWKLVEAGKAQFTPTWDLEACVQSK